MLHNTGRRIKKIRRVLKHMLCEFLSPKDAIYYDSQYIKKVISRDKRYVKSLGALDLTQGLTLGSFDDIHYLMCLEPGDTIESSVFVEGTRDKHLANICKLYLNKPNMAMIDVGANVGTSSIPLAKKYPQAHFYCFEPHPHIYEKLKKNSSLNKLDNLQPLNFAVSDSPDKTLTFYATKNVKNMGTSSTKLNCDIKAYDKLTVNNVSLDAYFKECLQTIAVIKIDVQGAEQSVLKSAEHIIEKHRPLVIFEFEYPYYPSATEREEAIKFTQEFFKKFNYFLVGINKTLNFFPVINLEKYYNGDLLAIPL